MLMRFPSAGHMMCMSSCHHVQCLLGIHLGLVWGGKLSARPGRLVGKQYFTSDCTALYRICSILHVQLESVLISADIIAYNISSVVSQ